MLTLRAAVQKLSFIGNLRITALFSDQIPFPGVQNLCITFTDRYFNCITFTDRYFNCHLKANRFIFILNYFYLWLSIFTNNQVEITIKHELKVDAFKSIYYFFRPELGFNVELLDAINIDTFGVDKLISDVIEDVLAKRKIY